MIERMADIIDSGHLIKPINCGIIVNKNRLDIELYYKENSLFVVNNVYT